MDQDHALPKEKLKSLSEMVHCPLRLLGVNSIVTHASVRADNHSCVARTCWVSLKSSHLVDNTAL